MADMFRAGETIRQLWLPPCCCAAERRGLAGQRWSCRTTMATGGDEGATEPAEEARLWVNHGSCIRLKPAYCDHVWSYDFVHCRTDDGWAFRTLNTLDEFSRDCLVIRLERKLNSTDVNDALTDLFILRRPPTFVRSDNVLCRENLAAWVSWSWGIRLPGHRDMVARRALPSRNDLFHSKHGVRTATALPSSIRDLKSQAEGPNTIYEVSKLPPQLVGERSFRLGSPPTKRGP